MINKAGLKMKKMVKEGCHGEQGKGNGKGQSKASAAHGCCSCCLGLLMMLLLMLPQLRLLCMPPMSPL